MCCLSSFLSRFAFLSLNYYLIISSVCVVIPDANDDRMSRTSNTRYRVSSIFKSDLRPTEARSEEEEKYPGIP